MPEQPDDFVNIPRPIKPAFRIQAKRRGAPQSDWAEVKRVRPRGTEDRQRRKTFAQVGAMRDANYGQGMRGQVFRIRHEDQGVALRLVNKLLA